MGPTSQNNITPQAIRAALTHVVSSAAFNNTERLQQILTYVVERHLAGDDAHIKAKSIALDVYGYTPKEVGERENAVRVDAGRLRRRLEDYYATEGKADDLIFALPKGRYAPEIRHNPNKFPNPDSQHKTDFDGPGTGQSTTFSAQHNGKTIAVAAVSALVAIGIVVFLWFSTDSALSVFPNVTNQERTRVAVFQASPKRLQAMNLADAGRDLIFPAVAPIRRQAALLIFQASIEADSTFFGGYAGAAQIHALNSLLVNNPATSQRELKQATDMVEIAVEIAPDEAWSHSARATQEWAQGNYEAAKTQSRLALSVNPDDGHLLEFDALISLFSGDFEQVINSVGTGMELTEQGHGSVVSNALGAAYFHIGNAPRSLEIFEQAIAAGAPSGPISIAYMAAAHQVLGQKNKATKRAQQLLDTWPAFPLDRLFLKLFANEADASRLIQAVKEAGWDSPN